MSKKRTKEYRAWCHMKGRCYDLNDSFYHRYGGRGIVVCDRWKSNFDNFLNDVGPAPDSTYCLDRINNNGNYEPNNVRWATQKQQANNRGGNRLKMITFEGKTQNLSDWSKETGLHICTIQTRIKLKWPIEKVLSPRKYHKSMNKIKY